jgi:hypothetical protein
MGGDTKYKDVTSLTSESTGYWTINNCQMKKVDDLYMVILNATKKTSNGINANFNFSKFLSTGLSLVAFGCAVNNKNKFLWTESTRIANCDLYWGSAVSAGTYEIYFVFM